MIAGAATISPIDKARDVISLSKPRLSTLVMITCGSGVWLAPGHLGPVRTFLTIIGTAMLVGAANALNCFYEREIDGLMHRTRNRPLPAGRLEPRVAIVTALVSVAGGVPALWVGANSLTALLGLLALLIYVFIYTPMKRTTTWSLLVGAVPGAIPPLMGWAAVTGSIDLGGLILFGILFTWQLPHFLAISIHLAEDYDRGGLRVFSVVHGTRTTWWAIVGTSVLTMAVSLLPWLTGMAGWPFAVVAAALGVALIAASVRGLSPQTDARWARTVFLGSTLYLTLLMVALAVGATSQGG